MKNVMKCITTASLAMIDTSPVLAEGSRGGSLIGAIVAAVATIVPARNVSASNNVSVSGGNEAVVSAVAPIAPKNGNILSTILDGGWYGRGCN